MTESIPLNGKTYDGDILARDLIVLLEREFISKEFKLRLQVFLEKNQSLSHEEKVGVEYIMGDLFQDIMLLSETSEINFEEYRDQLGYLESHLEILIFVTQDTFHFFCQNSIEKGSIELHDIDNIFLELLASIKTCINQLRLLILDKEILHGTGTKKLLWKIFQG